MGLLLSSDFRAVLMGPCGLEKMILDASPRYEQGSAYPPVPIPFLRILVLGGLSDFSDAEYVLSHFFALNVLNLTIMFPNIYNKLIAALPTSRMPKVRILVIANLPIDGTLLARWLDARTYIHLASANIEVLKSERTQTNPANFDESLRTLGQPPPKHLICPKVIWIAKSILPISIS